MAKDMSRVRWMLVSTAFTLCVADVSVQSPAATLAPTGTLRAVFLGGNPVQGRVDSKTGDASGTVPDLVRELATRLKVPVSLVSAPNAGAVIGALNDGKADIGFLAYDEERSREVDFGPAFVVMQNSYLVKAASPIKVSADVDREGVIVAAVKGRGRGAGIAAIVCAVVAPVAFAVALSAFLSMGLAAGSGIGG